MAAYPYARVGHLLGMDYPVYGSYSHRSTTTPTTLSGNDGAISSYALCIGHRDRDGRGWWVYQGKNSPTTNRHVRALKAVLEHNGYGPTGEIRHDNAGMGRTITRRLWAKTQED
jgi:hypothetical protein